MSLIDDHQFTTSYVVTGQLQHDYSESSLQNVQGEDNRAPLLTRPDASLMDPGYIEISKC